MDEEAVLAGRAPQVVPVMPNEKLQMRATVGAARR